MRVLPEHNQRRSEFRSKVEQLLEQYWDCIGPTATLDPGEPDNLEDFSRRDSQRLCTAWILVSEFAEMMDETEEPDGYYFGISKAFQSPIMDLGLHQQGVR